jgi:hypothetical protein
MRLATLFSLVGLAACAPATWTPQTIPACLVATGDVQSDRERSYLAALLALETRGYVLLHAESPAQIEAEYGSASDSDTTRVRWLVDAQPDGSLRVDSIPAGVPPSKKAASWYQKLEQSVRTLQCRDLNWLRWEAQNRGLMPMIGMAGAAEVAAPTAGGERPAGAVAPTDSAQSGQSTLAASAALAAPQPSLPSAQTVARRQELERQRRELRLTLPIALMATGLVAVAGAAGMGGAGLMLATETCATSDPLPQGAFGINGGSCSQHLLGRNLMIGAGAMAAVGIVFLALGIPRLVTGLNRQRQLNREIRALREPQLSFGATRESVNLSLRAAF